MNKIILLCVICVVEGYLNEELVSLSITRHHKGDVFTAQGEKCYKDLCVGLSSGTGISNGNSGCECKCLQNRPVFRDDLNICVDDIKECSLVPFASSTTLKKIPYVFLPLKGQIVYPSAEIIISEVGTPVCVVSGGQFLSKNGWLNLRNNTGIEPPFRLFRDEGKTYLQWLGETSLRMAMEGRIILVHLMCKDANFVEEPKIFTPCIAFRVAGNPTVREVMFGTDVHLKEEYSGGLSIREYVAIGICSLLLTGVYVASVFLYLQWRRRKRKGSKKTGEDTQLTLGEEGVIKNNPLLQANRHLNSGQENAGYITDSNSCCSDGDQSSDLLCLDDDDLGVLQNVKTSAIIHPCNTEFGETILNQDSTTIEKLPEENVSIIETLESKEDNPDIKAMGCVNGRRKLYFNPSYFEPDLLKAPPPAALEFLTKIREVIAIAKHKMSSKRFSPSLIGIPEEEGSQKTTESSSQAKKSDETKNLLTADNFQLMSNEFCCPLDAKQKIIRKWLEDIPVIVDQKEPIRQKHVVDEIKNLNKSKLWQINENKILPVAKEFKIPVPPIRMEKKKPSTKGKAPPLPPQQKEEANAEEKKKNTNIPPPPPRPPPMPLFPKETEVPMVQGKDRVPPAISKNLMDAVIQELAGYKRKNKFMGMSEFNQDKTELDNKKEEESNQLIEQKEKEPEVNNSGQVIGENHEVKVTENKLESPKTPQDSNQDDHEYEVILLSADPKAYEQKTKDLKIYNLPEILSKNEKNEGYSLVSEVYVNDGYSCCSGESPPSSFSSTTSGKIRYESVTEKPGRLTIHVNDSPEQYQDTKEESDNFEPDTLDRKPRKKSKQTNRVKENEECERYSNQKFHDMDCYKKPVESPNNENFTDSLERPSISLKTNGSFKRNSIERNIDDLLRNFNWNRVENFGSLREIYEAKSRQHKRRTETTSLIGSVHSDNDRISTLSWSEERRNKLLHRGIILHIAETESRKSKSPCKAHNASENVPSRPPKPCSSPSPSPSPRSRSQSPSVRNNCVSLRGIPSNTNPSTRNSSPPLPPQRSLPVPVPPCSTNIHKSIPSPPTVFRSNVKTPRTPPICSSPTSQPSSLPPKLNHTPPLPPRNTKPPLPPKSVTRPRQRIPANKFAGRPLPPLPNPRSTNPSPSPTISYKDPETLSTLSGASMDSLNSSEYEAFYTLPYEEDNSTSDVYKPNKNSSSDSVSDGGRRKSNQRIVMNKGMTGRVEDSGYLSTDSNDSCFPAQMSRIPESNGSQNSETEESFGDGASESGAESTTTDSFFYGDFKTEKTAEDGVSYPSFSLRLSDVEVNSDTERHCVPIMVRP